MPATGTRRSLLTAAVADETLPAREDHCLEPGMRAERIQHMPTLVDEIGSSQPELRVLYIRDHTEERPPGDDGDGALRTPFSIDELREAVAAPLDRIPEAAS
jgi:hypothetical protein